MSSNIGYATNANLTGGSRVQKRSGDDLTPNTPSKRTKTTNNSTATGLSKPTTNATLEDEDQSDSMDWDYNGTTITTLSNGVSFAKYGQPQNIMTSFMITGQKTALERIITQCYDITLVLFENMDEVTATCLALCNRYLYAIHKQVHKHPAHFESMVFPGRDKPIRLHQLIQDWSGLGPNYRLAGWGQRYYDPRPFFAPMPPFSLYPPLFLNCKIYGENNENEDQQLLEQRWNFYFASSYSGFSRDFGPLGVRNSSGPKLPRPFGMGETWYDAALAVDGIPPDLRMVIKSAWDTIKWRGLWHEGLLVEGSEDDGDSDSDNEIEGEDEGEGEEIGDQGELTCDDFYLWSMYRNRDVALAETQCFVPEPARGRRGGRTH